MKVLRRAGDRDRHLDAGFDVRHGLAGGPGHDPAWMGWGALRVANELRIAPGAMGARQPRANMEILSYVLEGALAQRDDAGATVVAAGTLQWIGAGHGVDYAEGNAASDAPLHLWQAWIQPARVNARPDRAQRRFPADGRRGRWALLASPDGADGSLAIRQQARLHATCLGCGEALGFELDPERRYWLQLLRGAALVDGEPLAAGDALGIDGEGGALAIGGSGPGPADILVFELPR